MTFCNLHSKTHSEAYKPPKNAGAAGPLSLGLRLRDVGVKASKKATNASLPHHFFTERFRLFDSNQSGCLRVAIFMRSASVSRKFPPCEDLHPGVRSSQGYCERRRTNPSFAERRRTMMCLRLNFIDRLIPKVSPTPSKPRDSVGFPQRTFRNCVSVHIFSDASEIRNPLILHWIRRRILPLRSRLSIPEKMMPDS